MGYNEPQPIQALHPSIRALRGGRKPAGMSSVMLPRDSHEILTNLAIGVFVDCVNSGKSFQDAILAVYMTGAENALRARDDEE